ncbi:MAG: hypothetical protein GTN76_12390 [Candidatus Aenigmarchaeota archaeon]|nr:hypothetical protein [Candidatus Aenigmarchaeota archaeon]
MNSQKIIVSFFVLFSLILASGCVMPGLPFNSQTPVGTGIVIESFRTDPELSEVYSNEEIKFILKFRNTGTVKVENCYAEVLGLDQMWKGKDDARKNPSNQEVFPYERECQYDQRGSWIVLLPPDPSTGIEGGDHICTWGYIAPDVPPGIHADYKPRARVFYDYKTHVVKTITLVPQDELRVIQNQGKSLPVETTSESGSPISLDIETRSPIRTYGKSMTFPMVIKVENIGGGTVCSNSENCRKYAEGGALWNQFRLTIELPDGMGFEQGSCTGNEDVYLVMGKSQTISCKVQVHTIPERLIQKNIRLTAEYGYFIDKTIEIRVLPSG